jgi:colicin import membrane protein
MRCLGYNSVACNASGKCRGPRCLVPESRDANLSRQAEEALWQSFFMAAPVQRREFEPNSKRPLDRSRGEHDKAMAAIEDQRKALDRRSEAEAARWDKEKQKLEEALRKARE